MRSRFPALCWVPYEMTLDSGSAHSIISGPALRRVVTQDSQYRPAVKLITGFKGRTTSELVVTLQLKIGHDIFLHTFVVMDSIMDFVTLGHDANIDVRHTEEEK